MSKFNECGMYANVLSQGELAYLIIFPFVFLLLFSFVSHFRKKLDVLLGNDSLFQKEIEPDKFNVEYYEKHYGKTYQRIKNQSLFQNLTPFLACFAVFSYYGWLTYIYIHPSGNFSFFHALSFIFIEAVVLYMVGGTVCVLISFISKYVPDGLSAFLHERKILLLILLVVYLGVCIGYYIRANYPIVDISIFLDSMKYSC
ncbi:MAG: hypothetical protein H8D23_38880 [Candidatus Brocadiales bacterium]|nr:hypothetical protein [Candidatus Brocadiales bacterium]